MGQVHPKFLFMRYFYLFEMRNQFLHRISRQWKIFDKESSSIFTVSGQTLDIIVHIDFHCLFQKKGNSYLPLKFTKFYHIMSCSYPLYPGRGVSFCRSDVKKETVLMLCGWIGNVRNIIWLAREVVYNTRIFDVGYLSSWNVMFRGGWLDWWMLDVNPDVIWHASYAFHA